MQSFQHVFNCWRFIFIFLFPFNLLNAFTCWGPTGGNRILLLGDSHTAATFGSSLESSLRGEMGHRTFVRRCARNGITASRILEPSARQFQPPPSALIVALGTNDAIQLCHLKEDDQKWNRIHRLIKRKPAGRP